MNKKVLIGLGLLAVAGIGFYFYNKNKSTQNKEIDWKKTDAEIAKEFGLDMEQVIEMRKKAESKSNARGEVHCKTSHLRGNYNLPEEKANARGATNTAKMCCTEPLVNGYCYGSWISCSRVSALDGTSNAIGRRNLGVSRGNLGGGIVNIADPAKLCCCAGTADAKGWCNNPSTRCCPDIAGQPAPLPTNLGFSGAINRVGLSTGNVQAKQNCADKSKIWCTKRQPDGTYKDGCLCNNPTKDIGTKIEDSGFNGYVNSYNNSMYNDLTLLVDPANV